MNVRRAAQGLIVGSGLTAVMIAMIHPRAGAFGLAVRAADSGDLWAQTLWQCALGATAGVAVVAARWSVLAAGIPALVLGISYATILFSFTFPDESPIQLTVTMVEFLRPEGPVVIGVLAVASVWQLRHSWLTRLKDLEKLTDYDRNTR